MTQNYRVLKQFSGDRLFKVGETVALDGRNVQKLIDMRYLAPIDGAPTPVAAQAPVSTTPLKRGRGRPRKTSAPVLDAVQPDPGSTPDFSDKD